MRRLHVDELLGLGINPTAENTTAGKHQSMDAVVIDDGQLTVAVERRTNDPLPLYSGIIWRGDSAT